MNPSCARWASFGSRSSTASAPPAPNAGGCSATSRAWAATATIATGGVDMGDPFVALVHELGEELFGVQYVWMRAHVEQWASENPERVTWLEQRLLAYARRPRP